MDRAEELHLLEELVDLNTAREPFLDDAVTQSDVDRYASQDRFRLERDRIFRRVPQMAAHASELAGKNDFVTLELAGPPILLVRGNDGVVRGFLNVCRHRGARLEGMSSGCKRMFSCPYHAWTYGTDGALRAVPQEAEGFPGLDKTNRSLRQVPVAERFGFIWVIPDPAADPIDDAFFEPLEELIGWLALETHTIAAQTEIDCAANWKLLVEGGIEAYHFKIAHKNTIGPHFINNLSSYRVFEPHLRSVLPRESLARMAELPKEDWAIREFTNVLYTVFPSTQFLVMQDHVAWLSFRPTDVGRTMIRLTTLADAGDVNDETAAHWARNQDITVTTLSEDFEIGEAIQSGFESGANDALLFGRYEGALDRFNRIVEDALD